MSNFATGSIDTISEGIDPTNTFVIKVKGMNSNPDQLSLFAGKLDEAVTRFNSVGAPAQFKLNVAFDNAGAGSYTISGMIGAQKIDLTLTSNDDGSIIKVTGDILGGSSTVDSVTGAGYWNVGY
jgi:hypothetical protein